MGDTGAAGSVTATLVSGTIPGSWSPAFSCTGNTEWSSSVAIPVGTTSTSFTIYGGGGGGGDTVNGKAGGNGGSGSEVVATVPVSVPRPTCIRQWPVTEAPASADTGIPAGVLPAEHRAAAVVVRRPFVSAPRQAIAVVARWSQLPLAVAVAVVHLRTTSARQTAVVREAMATVARRVRARQLGRTPVTATAVALVATVPVAMVVTRAVAVAVGWARHNPRREVVARVPRRVRPLRPTAPVERPGPATAATPVQASPDQPTPQFPRQLPARLAMVVLSPAARLAAFTAVAAGGDLPAVVVVATVIRVAASYAAPMRAAGGGAGSSWVIGTASSATFTNLADPTNSSCSHTAVGTQPGYGAGSGWGMVVPAACQRPHSTGAPPAAPTPASATFAVESHE